MIIRPATLADRSAIFAIARAQSGRYPHLRMDVEKVHESLKEVITGKHFAYVAEDEGVVRGVLLGLVSDNLWAQRQNCNIVLWVSDIPGAGAKLLRRFRDWVKSTRFIKVAGMSPDLEVDRRALSLARRIGFERSGGAYLLYN